MKQFFEFLAIISTMLVATGEILKQINVLRRSMDRAEKKISESSKKKKKKKVIVYEDDDNGE